MFFVSWPGHVPGKKNNDGNLSAFLQQVVSMYLVNAVSRLLCFAVMVFEKLDEIKKVSCAECPVFKRNQSF
jgi:hypothetical protein